MIGLLARPYSMTLAPSFSESTAYSASFPKINGLNNDYGRVFRTGNANGGSTFSIGLDLGASKPVDVIGLLWHNMRSTDRIVVRAGTSPDTAVTGSVYTSGELTPITGTTQRDVAPLSKFILTLATAVSARYWNIALLTKSSNNPTGFIQASRIFVGKGATFAIGPQKALLGAKDMNSQITTEVGEQRSQEDPGLIRPVASLSFKYAKLSEMEQVLGQYTLGLGISRPMLVCTDLTSANLQDNVVFGRAEQVLVHESDAYDVWSFEATVASIGP